MLRDVGIGRRFEQGEGGGIGQGWSSRCSEGRREQGGRGWG
jgi:hypothetical protein